MNVPIQSVQTGLTLLATGLDKTKFEQMPPANVATRVVLLLRYEVTVSH